jgi:hypothetical protein
MALTLSDRAKSLEEEFFDKKNRELLKTLKAHEQEELDAKAITQVTGITDKELIAQLVGLKLNAQQLAAFTLYPLIEVAWADGAVDDDERAAVLEAATQTGIKASSPAYELLTVWLGMKPPAAYGKQWTRYASALVTGLKPADKKLFRENLIGRAKKVAEASGGILGLGSKISKSERDVLKGLEEALK